METKKESQSEKAGRLVPQYLAENPGASIAKASRAVGLSPQVYYNYKASLAKGTLKKRAEPKVKTFDTFMVPQVAAKSPEKVIVIVSPVDKIAFILKEVWG